MDDWLLDLAVLEATLEAAERAHVATSLAPRAIADTGQGLGERAALRLWLASDLLHAAGGPGWQSFSFHRKTTALDWQRRDAEHRGSWQVIAGPDTASDVPALTATHLLVLECTYRLAR